MTTLYPQKSRPTQSFSTPDNYSDLISSKASNGAVAEPQACRHFRVPERVSASAAG